MNRIITIIVAALSLADTGPAPLVAPQKMKGLIKVKEGLRVEFNLVLKQV